MIGRHTEDFANLVRVLSQMILPEWMDIAYRTDLSKTKNPILFFGAITRLLHRRQFFEHSQKVDLIQ